MHYLGRTALSKRIFTGLQPRRLGKLVAELAGTWMAAGESGCVNAGVTSVCVRPEQARTTNSCSSTASS